MRLGEILVVAGILDQQQLERALQAQVMLGARLGTCLVELGLIDLDGLANALSHQHGLPAALASHFDRANPTLQLALDANLAERYACVPLFHVGKRSAVIAATGPLAPRTLAIIAEDLGMPADRLIASIAPELRIRYTLERVYNITRPQRFLRAPGAPRAKPISHVFPDSGVLLLDEVPEPPRHSREETADRRRYVATLGELQSEKDAVIAIDPETDLEEIPDDDLPTAVDMIAAGRDREEIASLAIAVIRRLVADTDGVVLLNLRGAIVVTAASFRRDGKKLRSAALAVEEENAVAIALRTKTMVQRGPTHSDSDRPLLAWLGLDGGYLVAAPLLTASRAIAVLVVASRKPVDAAVVETIASAMSAGFTRLMREALA